MSSGSTYESIDTVIYGRLVGADRSPVNPSDVSSIAYTVYQVGLFPGPANNYAATDREQTAAGTFTVNDVMFDVYQSDGRFPDKRGYNFRATVPGASFPAAVSTLYSQWPTNTQPVDDAPHVWYEIPVVFTFSDSSNAAIKAFVKAYVL